ncbi:hypothetical protein POVWA1_068820 [Plasmodium ovale wallikeri]|nr:hypothetical protein POVWA1_068820 [Plasmodium ovale wallikeri]
MLALGQREELFYERNINKACFFVTCLPQVRIEEVELPQSNALEKTLPVEHPSGPNIFRTAVAQPTEDLSCTSS